MRIFVFTRDSARVDEWRNFVVKAIDGESAKDELVSFLLGECHCKSDNEFEWRICNYCYARELIESGDFEMRMIELETDEFEMILMESSGG